MLFTTGCPCAILIIETMNNLILQYHGDHGPEWHSRPKQSKSVVEARAVEGPAWSVSILKIDLNWYRIAGISGSVMMQSESFTMQSHGYDVWFAKDRTWAAQVTPPATAKLYLTEMGHSAFNNVCKKIRFLAEKCSQFAGKSCFATTTADDIIDRN